VTHRAALDVSGIDTAGSDNGDGTRSWDYAAMLPGDQSLLIETLPLAGQWYESLYPNANYAARLGADSDLLGVFELTADAVLLVGVVSSADGFTRTELEYDPPVVTLDYPLSLGKTWQSSSTVSGLALGVVTVYSESYDFEVDQQGDLTTPFGTFPVLRLRSTLTRTFGVIDTVIRSHGFMTECFGLVASVRSQDNEPNVEFSNAAELRRIIP
jgi:hypothetical protein